MKVLVTGAAGFIGMHCAKRLLERGDEVVGIDNLNNYYSVQLKKDRLAGSRIRGSGFAQIDIADAAALERVFENETGRRAAPCRAGGGALFARKPGRVCAVESGRLRQRAAIVPTSRAAQPRLRLELQRVRIE